MSNPSKLFSPLRIGNLSLAHRLVMAPMTRLRATDDGTITDITAEYYSQRSSLPGTLIITEGTIVAAEAGGLPNCPGVYTDAQVAGWKKVVDAVHANGSFIFLQISALGRMGYPERIHAAGYPYVSSSPTQQDGRSEVPVELAEEDIKRYVGMYAEAAERAVHVAGFDGVEIHACNGSLIEQFIEDVVNKRADNYGGSIENRSRFVLEVTDAVVARVGAKRTSIRLSPWNKFNGMGMRNPIPTYSHIVTELSKRHSELAYIHLIEATRDSAGKVSVQTLDEGVTVSNDFAYQLWAPRPYLTAGGYDANSASEAVDRLQNTGIVIGRPFIANPDLPTRIRSGIELAVSDSSTHYAAGPEGVKGYTDYPTASVSVSV